MRSPLELAGAEEANRTKRAELSHRTVLQTHICASFPSPSALVNTCYSGARQLPGPISEQAWILRGHNSPTPFPWGLSRCLPLGKGALLDFRGQRTPIPLFPCSLSSSAVSSECERKRHGLHPSSPRAHPRAGKLLEPQLGVQTPRAAVEASTWIQDF